MLRMSEVDHQSMQHMLSTTESALTVHLVILNDHPGDAFIDALKARFSVHYCTLQVEQGTTDHSYALHPSTVPHVH